MSYPKAWTELEDILLREVLEGGGTFNDASDKTRRSRDACKNRAAKLGIESAFNRLRAEKAKLKQTKKVNIPPLMNNLGRPYSPRWTRQEDFTLLSMRKEHLPLEEIAAAVGRSKDACETRIKRLGFRIRLTYKRRSPKWHTRGQGAKPELTATLLEQRDALGGRLYLVEGLEHEHVVPESIVKLSDWAICETGCTDVDKM